MNLYANLVKVLPNVGPVYVVYFPNWERMQFDGKNKRMMTGFVKNENMTRQLGIMKALPFYELVVNGLQSILYQGPKKELLD